jgi:hypothetical protein
MPNNPPPKQTRRQHRANRHHIQRMEKTRRPTHVILKQLPWKARTRVCSRLTRRQFITTLLVAVKSNSAPRLVLISTHLQNPAHTTDFSALFTNTQNSAPMARIHNLLIIIYLANVIAPLTIALLGALATYVMGPPNPKNRTNTRHVSPRTNKDGHNHTTTTRSLQRPDPLLPHSGQGTPPPTETWNHTQDHKFTSSKVTPSEL